MVPRPEGTCAMPSRATSSGALPVMFLPPNLISPVAFTMPVMARRVVVLPAPLAPRRATTEPSSTFSETPWRARMAP